MPSWPARRSVSPASAFSMWRRGPHARGEIHEPGRASKSRPARRCDSTQARPSKMPSIRRLRRRAPGRSLYHQRNPWCGSKRLSLCGRAGTAASALAVLRGAGERPKTRLLCERNRGFESVSLQEALIQTPGERGGRRREVAPPCRDPRTGDGPLTTILGRWVGQPPDFPPSGDVEATMPALLTKLIKDGASV